MPIPIDCPNPQCKQPMACPEEMAGQQVSCPKCGTITRVPAQQLGNYTIVRKIGEGGMGTVFEAMQAGINRRVALKVLPAKFRPPDIARRSTATFGGIDHES
jgi:serine/threonine protein kinase